MGNASTFLQRKLILLVSISYVSCIAPIEIIINQFQKMDRKYLEHKVFNQLSEHSTFYSDLSYMVMSELTHGITISNIDSHVFSSMSETLESIRDILLKGRINDSYALLRKYYDASIMNIYANVYLEKNFCVIDNYIVEQIENWINGNEKLPSYGIMSNYIRSSPKLKSITDLLE